MYQETGKDKRRINEDCTLMGDRLSPLNMDIKLPFRIASKEILGFYRFI